MKPQEIDKIRSLDKDGVNGTIQSVLLNPDVSQAHYAEVLYYLLSKTIEEKGYLERISNAMTSVLLAQGLHQELNICLELEVKL